MSYERRCVALLAVCSQELDAERRESKRLRQALLLTEENKVRNPLNLEVEASLVSSETAAICRSSLPHLHTVVVVHHEPLSNANRNHHLCTTPTPQTPSPSRKGCVVSDWSNDDRKAPKQLAPPHTHTLIMFAPPLPLYPSRKECVDNGEMPTYTQRQATKVPLTHLAVPPFPSSYICLGRDALSMAKWPKQ